MSGRTRDRIPSRYLPEIVEEKPSAQKFHNLYYRSDWPALSDTGTDLDTPECVELGSSGSSGSSTFSWADPRDSLTVALEWEKIQRTLYDEPGPKVQHKRLLDECEQWKTIFPHLRITGTAFILHRPDGDTRPHAKNDSEDCNSDLGFILDSKNYITRDKLPDKVSGKRREGPLEEINSYINIIPVHSSKSLNVHRVGTSSSIVRSELSSSKWRHKNTLSPDYPSLSHINNNNNKDYLSNRFGVLSRDNSATSYYSICSKNNIKNEIRPSNENVTSSRRKNTNGSFENGIDRNSPILEPISFSKIITDRSVLYKKEEYRNGISKNKNISLPPLQHEENKIERIKLTNPKDYKPKKHVKNKSLTPLNLVPVEQSFSILEPKKSAYLRSKTPTKRPNFVSTVKNS